MMTSIEMTKKRMMIKIPADYQEKHDYFVLPTVSAEHFNWQEIFGNNRPVHLEIGAGKGEFISQIALLCPEINFVAIELKHKRVVSILKKLSLEKHSNVRVLEMFVDSSFVEKVIAHSFSKIYIQHPDPWPKRKHIKNRILQQEFIDCLKALLVPEGLLEISSDHRGYIDWAMQEFSRRQDFVSTYEKGYSHQPPENHVITFFEEEMRKKGYEPLFLQYRVKI
jgi:tRNA (guanine-N7-)-methyltransferase